MTNLALDDIQGFVMRTYAMPALRTFVLTVSDPAAASTFLRSMVSGDSTTPQLTTAGPWAANPAHVPDYCVNVAFTHDGLAAMKLPADSLATFPEEFVAGAVARAAHIGDTGDSAPETWKGGLAGPGVHALLFVFAQSEPILERVTTELRAGFAGGFVELSVHDARGLP